MSVPQLKQEISKQKTAVKNLEKKIAAEEFLNAFMPSAYKKTAQNTPKLKTLYEHHKKLAKSLAALERELSVKALKAFLATRGAPKTKSAPAKRVPASVSRKSAITGGATVPKVVVKPVVIEPRVAATTVTMSPIQEQLIIMSTKPIPRNAVQARVILEVPIDADGIAIKNSFYRLSRKYHPDKHPKNMEKNATQAITRINRAYEILTK